MNFISKRAAVEKSSVGVGVSVSVRKFWRNYYIKKNMPSMLGRNAVINDIIGADFKGAKPLHRFVLKSGEAAEIRRSHEFYYVAAIREGGQYDVIVIQPAYKESSPEITSLRMAPDWLKAKYWKKKT